MNTQKSYTNTAAGIKVALTGGGTGGHVYPAISIAQALKQTCPGIELLYIGSSHGPEGEIARDAGLDFISIPSGPISRSISIRNMRSPFYEYLFNASLIDQAGSRFVDHRDLALFKIEAKGDMPFVEFYSEDRPELQVGDRLTLCHYIFPDREADPTFMLNPIEVVGVIQTPSGMQYLADGYCRYGSSGGAILKDGKLVSIQSSTYPVNAHEIGEIPIGLLSFHPVWRSLVAETLDTPEPDTTEHQPAADQP